ncbi:MAG: diadenylate cyclase CdaA [Cyclobacteriaceae bacterium]
MIQLIAIGFLSFRFIDLLDILLVTFLLFQLYKLLKGTVAIRIFLGILAIYLIYLVVHALGMELLSSIFGQFIGVGVLAAIILFQQEIRRFLLLIGKTNPLNNKMVGKLLKKGTNQGVALDEINIVLDSLKTLSATRTGALIVFPGSTELRFYANTGVELNAKLSKPLLISIFNKESPLHDGAVILSKGRVAAACCIMPVSENEEIQQSMGLRHRAAIGIAEVTDAVVLIVSEETGLISFCTEGIIEHNLPLAEVRKKLNEHLLSEEVKKFF